MPKAATINPNNLFYLARISASATNPELANRVEAARIACIPKGRLEFIEHGAVDPTPEELWMLTRAYNIPNLPEWFCENVCRYKALHHYDGENKTHVSSVLIAGMANCLTAL